MRTIQGLLASCLIATTAAHSQVRYETRKIVGGPDATIFGFADEISLMGDVLAVGDINAGADGQGRVFLYDITTGEETAQLIPSSPTFLWHSFGTSIDMGEGLIVVGAPGWYPNEHTGKVYVYAYPSGQFVRLIESTATNFGYDVKVRDNLLAISSYSFDTSWPQAVSSGRVFRYVIPSFFEVTPRISNNQTDGTHYGRTIALDEAIIAAPAPSANTGDGDKGRISLYNAVTGATEFTITDTNPDEAATLDERIAMDGRYMAVKRSVVGVGATVELYDVESGVSVRSFSFAADRYIAGLDLKDGLLAVVLRGQGSVSEVVVIDVDSGDQIAEFAASDQATAPGLGGMVSISGRTIAAAAPNSYFPYVGVPTVYIFLIPTAPCELADVNGDGIVSPADFTAWVAAFNAQSDACDQNEDLQCTPTDFSAWIANFNSGC